MAKKSVLHRNVNFHVAVIVITLLAGVAAGLMNHKAAEYRAALHSLDTAVLGAMIE